MMISSKFLRMAICGALLITSASALADDAALPRWNVIAEKSAIEWTATYGGKPISGAFKEFTTEIAFDPAHLDQSSALVKVDMSKVSSDDKDAEQSLPSPEWFDSATFPQAIFEAKVFHHIDDEKYTADGTLTIGDKKKDISLPFTVHFYDDNEVTPHVRYAQVTAEITIKRTDYGVGKGDWAKTDTVGDDVKVTISLKARQPEPAIP